MPHKRRRKGRKSKFVTKRGFPFQLMKYAESKQIEFTLTDNLLPNPSMIGLGFRSMVNIREGTDLLERVGREIQITGIYIKMIYQAENDNSVRWLRATLFSPRDMSNTDEPAFDMTGMIPKHWAGSLVVL